MGETSITTGRPQLRENPLGSFEYHHVGKGLLTGYRLERLGDGQEAFVATPAKALAGLVPGGDSIAYLSGLRLQDVEKIDATELETHPILGRRPKIRRTIRSLAALAEGRE